MRTRRGPDHYRSGPERTREGLSHVGPTGQSKLLWNFVSHICICGLSGLSTAKLRPILAFKTAHILVAFIWASLVGGEYINSDIPKSKTSFSLSTPVQIQCAPMDTLVNGNSHIIGSNNEYDTFLCCGRFRSEARS